MGNLYSQHSLFTSWNTQQSQTKSLFCNNDCVPVLIQMSPFNLSGSCSEPVCWRKLQWSHRCRSAGHQRSCSCCWTGEGSQMMRGWQRWVRCPTGWGWTDSARLREKDRERQRERRGYKDVEENINVTLQRGNSANWLRRGYGGGRKAKKRWEWTKQNTGGGSTAAEDIDALLSHFPGCSE